MGGASPGHTGGELFTTVMASSVDGASFPAGTVDNAIVSWTNPADSSTWAFVPHQRLLLAYKLQLDGAGNPSLALQWSLPNAIYPGSAILIANNVLYRVQHRQRWPGHHRGAQPRHERAAVEQQYADRWHSLAKPGRGQRHLVRGGQRRLRNSVCLAERTRRGAVARWLDCHVGPNSSGELPSNMLDGNIATRWATGTAQANTGNQWLRVDVGSVQAFNQLTLDSAGSGDFPRGYTFATSTDGTTFTR